MIWGWVKTYCYHILGNQYPWTSAIEIYFTIRLPGFWLISSPGFTWYHHFSQCLVSTFDHRCWHLTTTLRSSSPCWTLAADGSAIEASASMVLRRRTYSQRRSMETSCISISLEFQANLRYLIDIPWYTCHEMANFSKRSVFLYTYILFIHVFGNFFNHRNLSIYEKHCVYVYIIWETFQSEYMYICIYLIYLYIYTICIYVHI